MIDHKRSSFLATNSPFSYKGDRSVVEFREGTAANVAAVYNEAGGSYAAYLPMRCSIRPLWKSMNRSPARVAKKSNSSVRRVWTATEVHKLKGLPKKKVGIDKIARTLNRSVDVTAKKALDLGLSVDIGG
jgi:hypothetical protein